MSTATLEKCNRLRQRYYPMDERPGIVYEASVSRAAASNAVLLEIGCGREGRRLRRMAAHYRCGVGVDMEVIAQPSTMDHTWLILGDAHHLPIASNSVDVIAMANVAEHLAEPDHAFVECARVLRPHGRLIVMTVNQWFPPIALGRLLPHRLRQIANGLVSGTREEDTFPAFYRANTVASLERAANSAGLQTIEQRYMPHHPHYLMFSSVAYRLGIVMERLIRPWEGLRHMIHAVFVKNDIASPTSNENREARQS